MTKIDNACYKGKIWKRQGRNMMSQDLLILTQDLQKAKNKAQGNMQCKRLKKWNKSRERQNPRSTGCNDTVCGRSKTKNRTKAKVKRKPEAL